MIQLENVTKKYGKFVAVDNISFEVKENEIIGLLGPNGAGKTTTMNMITGYSTPTEGKIIVNKIDIYKNPNIVKKDIGYMAENAPLYEDLTVKEYINFIAELRKLKDKKKIVKEIIEEIKLKEVENKLIKKLSRGYKQRVSIAGTLIGDPKIIILDEPTVGLDPTQVIEIRELIKSLKKKHTVILSSHILSEVSQICDRVIIMNEGKIIVIDSPKNLEKLTGVANDFKVVVEDSKNNIMKMKSKVSGIEEIKLVRENADGTKEYRVIAKPGKEIRKEILLEFPKNDVVIFELIQEGNTLEDAFINLIEKHKKEDKGGKK